MRWKQVRKKVSIREDEAADDLALDEVGDLFGDDDRNSDAEAARPAGSDSDPSTPKPKNASKAKAGASEASIPLLPWSLVSMFPHAADVPSIAALENDEDGGAPELGTSSGSITHPWLLARLLKNDERTRHMTADEYAAWSECRSASFTYRKKKIFREWCGLGVIADHRGKDDVLEMLGFLTSEWVQTLTEEAMAAQEQETRTRGCEVIGQNAGFKRKFDDTGPFSIPVDEGEKREEVGISEQKPRSPIQPRHVRRAFELLQTPQKKYTAMFNGAQLKQRKKPRIVSLWGSVAA